MIELTVLRAITKREDYDKVKHYVSSDAIDEHTRNVVKTIAAYWELIGEAREVADMDVVRSMFFNTNKGLPEDSVAVYNELFVRMCTELTEHEQAVIINNLIEQELAVTIGNGLSEYEQASEIDFIEWTYQKAEEARTKMTLVTESNFASLHTMLERIDSDVAYQWTLKCLAAAFKDMTGARLTIIAALSDVGKTSFALNIAVGWARQTTKPILWLNNEGDKNDVLIRSYSIMFGVDEVTIQQWAHDGTLYKALVETFGREDPIRVYDVHRMDARQIEELIAKVHSHHGVGGVFFDMIDNVDMYVANKQARTDQILEKKYQWARALGVQYDYPTMAMSQQSETKEYVQFPDKSMLKDSKVGKQGASDNIIFVTQPEDDTIQNVRYISAPKNKTARKGSARLRAEVRFDRDTGIFFD